MNLLKGQDIVILLEGGDDFIAVIDDAIPTYYEHPENILIDPKETKWTMKEDETITTDANSYVIDGNGTIFYQINGPRPRNIVKR